MNFLENVAAKFGFYRNEKAVGPMILAAAQAGQGMSPRPTVHNMKDYLGRYADQAWVFACIWILQSKGAGVPLKVYRQNDMEELPAHPLKQLLDRVNPMQSGYDLKEATHGYIELTGNAYWLLDAFVNGKPTEIYPLNPQFIRIKADKDKFVVGYEYVINGQVVQQFRPEEILHFKNWNPLDEFYGLPRLAAGRDSSDSMMHADRYNKMFFENSAEPSGLLSSDVQISPDNKNIIAAAWQKMHQGTRKAHKVAILDGGLKWSTTSSSHKDMQFPELKKMTREDILAVFGVPPVMVGVFDEANYANSREQRRIFWMDSMVPRLSKITSVLNEFLVKPFDSNVVVAYDLSEIEDLQDDKKAKAEEEEILVRSGIVTINEIREKRKLSPVPWGDTWNAPVGIMPIDQPRNTPAAPPDPQNVPPKNDPQNDPEDDPIDPQETTDPQDSQKAVKVTEKVEAVDEVKSVEDQAKARRDTLWAGFKASTESQEGRWMPAIRKLFTEQEADVLSKLRDHWEKKSTQARLDGMKSVKQAIDVILFDQAEARRVFRKEGRKLMEFTLNAAGESEMNLYDLGTFNLQNPRVQEWLDQKAFKFANEVNDVTEEELRNALKDAVSAGESIGDVEKRIQNIFDMARGYRTERIARTEVIAASNKGAFSAYEESGVVQKTEWITARDQNVRDSHQIDGEQRGLGEAFTNGLTYPGDSNAPADEVINCRCTIAPVIERS